MARVAMALIIGTIFVLVFPGIMFNNFSQSYLVNGSNTVATFSETCDQTPGNPVCNSNVPVGCSVNSGSACTLSGNTFQFLNPNSPFTALLSGNILALFTPVNSNNANHGPFDPLGVTSYIRANCVIDDRESPGNSIGLRYFYYRVCTESNNDNSNTTKGNAATWSNWNVNFFSGIQAPFYMLPNASMVEKVGSDSHSNGWVAQINYTNGGSSSTGFTWYGVDFYNPNTACTAYLSNCVQNNRVYSTAISVPYELGVQTHANGYSCVSQGGGSTCWHISIWVALLPWDFTSCLDSFVQTASLFSSQQCTYFKQNYQNLAGSAGGNSFNFGWFTPIITFIIGIALLLLGLGIGISGGGSILGSGTTLGYTTNMQGTKLAQNMGIGLIIWSPLYSQFSTWFTSGLLPSGMDGATGIVSLILTGALFFGIWWQTESWN